MADLQAQRTLVKSPPELWAELSNPDALARRLSGFGEIRIIRLVPEKTVAWEGERASGTVELESSGWGTRVRLTASPHHDRTPPPGVAAVDRVTAVIDEEAEPPRLQAPVLERPPPDRPAPDPRPAPAALPTPTESTPPSPPAVETARAAPPTPPPAARRGFFARLFGRRRAPQTAAATDGAARPVAPSAPPAVTANRPDSPLPRSAGAEPPSASRTTAPPPDPATVPAPPATPPPARPTTPPTTPTRARSPSRQAARYPPPMPAPPPALDPEQTMAVLSSVLDDLGAAHHRPFSRE